MPTQPELRRIGSIDGLRALAFSLVFAFHTWEFSGRPRLGFVSSVVAQNTRPDFFVVLTGFVLTLPFVRHPERLENFTTDRFLIRRFRRIVIPYYAALGFAVLLPELLVVLVRMTGRPASWQPIPGWADWVVHLGFAQVFSAPHWAGINGSLWTVSLEMQLYLLFPLVILTVHRWGVVGVGVLLGTSIAYRLVAGLAVAGRGFPVEFLVGANGAGRLQEFAAGVVCSYLVFRPTDHARWFRTPILVAAMVVGYGLAVSPVGRVAWLGVRELGLAVAFASLVAVVLRNPVAGRVFGAGPVSWLGYRAYSCFLLHQPLMWFFSQFLVKMLGMGDGPAQLVVLWTAGFGVTVLAGQVFFLLVERPCIAWARRTPNSYGIAPSPEAVAASAP